MRRAVVAALSCALLALVLLSDTGSGIALRAADWVHQGFLAVYMDAENFIRGCF